MTEKKYSNGHGYEAYLRFIRKYDEAVELFKQLSKDYQQRKKNDGVFVDGTGFARYSPYLQSRVLQMQNFGVEDLANMSQQEADYISYVHGVPLFAAWRNSLDIYRIDADVFDELIKSPIPEDTPCEIFKRLPSFCVYVEFPRDVQYSEFLEKSIVGDLVCKGFWAYLGYEIGNPNKALQLNICVDTESNMYRSNFDTLSLVIHEGLTVKEASELVFKQYIGFPNEDAQLLTAKNDQKALFSFLPILLWLCVEDPDITNMKDERIEREQLFKPKYTIHKKTGAFVPPSQPTVFNLGKRLGAEIRNYQEILEKDLIDRPRAAVRPHIRRGHLHGYWVGKRGSAKFILKWVAATIVGV